MPHTEKMLDRVDDMMSEQHRMIEEVKALRTSNRVLKTIVIIVIIVLGAAGITSLYAFNASRDANAALAAQQQVSTEACRIRNNSTLSLRVAFDRLDARVAEVLLNFGIPQEDVDAFNIDADALLPAAVETDRDCNSDGVLGAADYPIDADFGEGHRVPGPDGSAVPSVAASIPSTTETS